MTNEQVRYYYDFSFLLFLHFEFRDRNQVLFVSKIMLNSKRICEDFYSFLQSQPELIKCANSEHKYSHMEKRVLNIANREGLFSVNICIVT